MLPNTSVNADNPCRDTAGAAAPALPFSGVNGGGQGSALVWTWMVHTIHRQKIQMKFAYGSWEVEAL